VSSRVESNREVGDSETRRVVRLPTNPIRGERPAARHDEELPSTNIPNMHDDDDTLQRF
jgi:hypothetical protein